ncbi:MAG: hypothetical protein KKA67_09635 [Spirochaetes bacterium]|nr:hypothetical protein [Spirochaetota bacterium]
MRNAVKGVRVLCAAFAIAGLSACADSRAVTELRREQLFSLGYGVLEDQLNLFNLEGKAPPQKTRLAMRDGIFFVANGNAAKVLTLSSFGDLLAMVYNSERNPPPLTLQQSDASAAGPAAQGRIAKPYPFLSPGEIAVDSKRTIFVEDRVPDSHRSYDEAMQASLEFVVLRFSRDGEYLDYLGQEGVGGTPFPRITGLYMSANDDCVVITLTGSGWSAFRFDPRGGLLSTVAIRRDDLPRPPEESGSIASLDRIVASPDGSGLILKIDYFKEIIDEETHTQAGIEFSSSWAWAMDGATGGYVERYELPTFEAMAGRNERGVSRAWELVGAAAGAIFLSAVDDDGATYYGLFDTRSKTMRRFSLMIDPEETLYASFSLSPDGILSALLASRYEARFVWWRFDKMLGGLAP